MDILIAVELTEYKLEVLVYVCILSKTFSLPDLYSCQ
jgi:hypothetical protein